MTRPFFSEKSYLQRSTRSVQDKKKIYNIIVDTIYTYTRITRKDQLLMNVTCTLGGGGVKESKHPFPEMSSFIKLF